MSFYNLFGFIGLLGIAAIIAIYMFRQKNKDLPFSSVIIWKRVEDLSQSNKTAFKKIKKNLLMLLQIMAALFLVLACARPYIRTTAEVNKYLIVVNSSFSMNAVNSGDEKSRFENAVDKAIGIVNSAIPNSTFSIVTVSQNADVVLSNGDKAEAKAKIAELRTDSLQADMQNAKQIITNIVNEDKSNVYYISDDTLTIEGLEINNIYVGSDEENCAITALSQNDDDDSLTVLATVRNFGKSVQERTVNIYADGKLVSSKKLSIKAGEIENAIFTDIDYESKSLMASITPEDCLSEDDYRYSVVNQEIEKKILLVGEDSYFLEKAFSSVPQLSVFKNSTSNIDGLSGYGLYVFNGVMPKQLPTDGQILCFNPPENEYFEVGKEAQLDLTVLQKGLNSELFNSIEEISFDILKAKEITTPEWGRSVLSCNGVPLIIQGDYSGEENNSVQKMVICAFDVQNTDFPLKKEFPIFIYNICEYFMPQSVIREQEAFVGQTMSFNILPTAQEARVISPGGEITEIAPPFPPETYTALEFGEYVLEQSISQDEKVYSDFAVNYSIGEESNLLSKDASASTFDDKAQLATINYGLQGICLILALILLITELILYSKKIKAFPKPAIIVLRLLTLIIAFLAIFQPKISGITNKTLTCFAVDTSASMDKNSNIDDAFDFINKALETKNKRDYTALVSFAQNTVTEGSVSNERESYSMGEYAQKDFTDIYSAIQRVENIFEDSYKNRLVLITDGEENLNSSISMVNSLKNKGVEVKVVQKENLISNEIQISDLSVPEYINIDSSYDVEVSISSMLNQEVNFNLYKNGGSIYSERLSIKKGDNNFVINDVADIGGSNVFKAEIEPVEDTFVENNSFYENCYVKATPMVLMLSENNGGNLKSVFESAGVSVTSVLPYLASGAIEQLNRYDAIILDNVAYESLNEAFVEALEIYVKNLGGGVIATGGNNSFALGGYIDTKLEEILPVEMKLKNQAEDEKVKIIIAIDRSGSMSSGEYGINKLSMAKEAVIKTIENLSEGDVIGVNAFDSESEWIIKPQEIGKDTSKLKESVSEISMGGGTSILTAVRDSYEVIKEGNEKSKHIILLSDGQAETSGYDEILGRMQAENITISTIAVGEDSDKELLQWIASKGGGRYYYTDVFSNLPNIFVKETQLANKKYVNNFDFYPTADTSCEVLSGISQLPVLNGYIGTTAKDRSEVALSFSAKDPVLAFWQYGLGRTAVFTPDVQNHCNEWLSADEGVRILRNSLSYILRKQNNSIAEITAEMNENMGSATVRVTFNKADEVNILEGSINGDGLSEDLIFQRVKPDEFVASTELSQNGSYVVNAVANGSVMMSAGVNINYSAEYNLLTFGKGSEKINEFVNALGENALIITEPEEVFKSINESLVLKGKVEITSFLIALAIILLVFEVALRRFYSFFAGLFKKNNKKKKKEKQEVQDIKKEKAPEKTDKKPPAEEVKKESTTSILLQNKRNRENK